MMPSVPVFPDETLAQVAGQLVAYDPLTGENEVILDQFVSGTEPVLDMMLPLELPNEPRELDAPFHAVVVPRRLRGLESRAPLMPGARVRVPYAVLRPSAVPVLGGVRSRSSGTELVLTDFPIRLTAADVQALELARDVLNVDELTLELQVLELSGATPSITVGIETGMQLESTAGWVSAGTFSPVSTAPSSQVQAFSNLLRYVRWVVSPLAGTGATFFISGVSRRWSKA